MVMHLDQQERITSSSSSPAVPTNTVLKVQAKESSSGSSLSSRKQHVLLALTQRWTIGGPTLLCVAEKFGKYLKRMLANLSNRIKDIVRPDTNFTYKEVPLSAESERALDEAGRKTLILDLDETLVHSCYNDPETNEHIGCSMVPPNTEPNFTISVDVEEMPVIFQVFKRPHVDLFLDFVAKWYDIVIYTASLEVYASQVVDQLDAGRGILRRRFFRQHCRSSTNVLSKDLCLVNRDLRRTFIIDNSPNAYRDYPENAIPIKTWLYDPNDKELLKLLPFLDALRFTKDVRTILSRRAH
ncbi:CTD nuclear envelope phosphatase 1 homolog [Scaptodrosophila lebanonensis]|uniref:CTD nuclear envelope phosphatase 1 homolog n=1 Tax=Drosophila lebanonensis TaxID=7225 RepID=A0A6J2UFW9_DROLE|nr:CTD nuclear envelope phosphatase 1 homolog [Scaptodrosophila lebanonensis]